MVQRDKCIQGSAGLVEILQDHHGKNGKTLGADETMAGQGDKEEGVERSLCTEKKRLKATVVIGIFRSQYRQAQHYRRNGIGEVRQLRMQAVEICRSGMMLLKWY